MFQDEVGFGRINKPKYCWCRRHLTERSLPSHPRIPLCLRRRRAAYGRKPLSDHAQLRQRLYEHFPAGTFTPISGRPYSAPLCRSRLAQLQSASGSRQHRPVPYPALYPRDEPHRADLERAALSGLSKRDFFDA